MTFLSFALSLSEILSKTYIQVLTYDGAKTPQKQKVECRWSINLCTMWEFHLSDIFHRCRKWFMYRYHSTKTINFHLSVSYLSVHCSHVTSNKQHPEYAKGLFHLQICCDLEANADKYKFNGSPIALRQAL